MIEFAKGKYRSKLCHHCRSDPERMKLAMKYDSKPHTNVQQKIKCKGCNILLIWWWFAKLPLTQEEKETVQNKRIRPGRV